MEAFQLAHHLVSATERPCAYGFVLHGVLGNRRNWQGFARRLNRSHPDWGWVLIDLRFHGESAGAPGPATLARAAEDVAELASSIGAPRALLGHSLGGRVAAAYAAQRSDLEQLWILDADLGALDGDPVSDATRILTLLQQRDPNDSPTMLGERLAGMGFSDRVVRWVQSSFRSDGEGGWTLSLQVDPIARMLEEARTHDLWPVLEQREGITHFVSAGRNPAWTAERLSPLKELHAGQALSWHEMPDAGHWLHVDDPVGLQAIFGEHL